MLVPLIVKEVIVPPLYVYGYNVHRCIMHNLRSHISVSCHCFFKGIDFLFQRSLPSRLISPLRVPAAWRRASPPTPFPLPPRALPRLSDIPPGLTCCLCIKSSPESPLIIMSTLSPDKRRKMESALSQLKKHTVVVADTGDFNGNGRTSKLRLSSS